MFAIHNSIALKEIQNMFCSLNNDLYQEAILNPLNGGARELSIITGYSSPAIVHKLFKDSHDMNLDIKLELIIGMTSGGIINSINHHNFLKLQENQNFLCRYVTNPPPVHAKLYLWFSQDRENITDAYGGSANFSVNGLISDQVEILSAVDKTSAQDFFIQVKKKSSLISDISIDDFSIADAPEKDATVISNNTITLTLLNSKNMDETPGRSGINWGQRPDVGREPNQAYINIPATINKENFFPEVAIPFIIQTDDNQTLAVVRAQDGGKGLHTYESNAAMGKYLRDRLGLKHGTYVTKQHLDDYGRTDVTIRKLDDETYYMDFSV